MITFLDRENMKQNLKEEVFIQEIEKKILNKFEIQMFYLLQKSVDLNMKISLRKIKCV
jgi:hypothetical protein